MNRVGRVEHLEESIIPKRDVWLTLINDDDEQVAIERHERKTGVRLDASWVNWVRVRIHDVE